MNVQKFSQIIERMDGGEIERDLQTALREAGRSLRRAPVKSKATITLKLTLEKVGFDQLTASADVNAKPAKRPSEPSIYFSTPDGDLTRNNPEASSFDFDAAPKE